MAPASTPASTRAAPPASASYLNERLRELNNNVEMSVAAYNGGEGRAARVFKQSAGQSFWTDSVYNQFPGETKDYVPMVIAAAWIFLHAAVRRGIPEDQRAAGHAAPGQVHHHLRTDHLPGGHGTRDGYMRARNLNPRYEADGWIPAGTLINATTRIAGLYQRNCVSGPRADLAVPDHRRPERGDQAPGRQLHRQRGRGRRGAGGRRRSLHQRADHPGRSGGRAAPGRTAKAAAQPQGGPG